MIRKRVIFPAFFLLFFSFWLVLVLNVVFKLYSTNQISLSSVSPFEAYFGLLYWLVAIVAAATSFTFGLDKLGILADLWNKISSKDKSYEPDVYVAIPNSEPVSSSTKATGKGHSLTEQNNVTALITKVNQPEKQKEDRIKKDKMKAFYLFGETEFKGCQHKFGFLGTALENRPIPDDCFGCPKIIECFKQTKNQNERIVRD